MLTDLISRDDVAGIIVEGTKSGLPNPNLYLYRQLLGRKIPIILSIPIIRSWMRPMCP